MDNATMQLAEVIFKAMNRKDFSDLDACLSEDVSFDFPGAGVVTGRKRVQTFLKVLTRKYPTLEFSVSDVIAEADRACVVWTNRGENSRGEPYSNSGITLLHMSEGKITFISDYFKDTSFKDKAS